MTFSLQKSLALTLLAATMLSLTDLSAQTENIKNTLPKALHSRNPNQEQVKASVRSTYKNSKVAQELWGLYQEYQQDANQKNWQRNIQAKGYDTVLVLLEDKVLIEAIAEQDAQALKTSLDNMGMERGSAYGRMVSGLFPIAKVAQLDGLTNLRFVRAGYRPISRAGIVTSQGDAAQGSDLARIVCGLTGTGTTIGILSDSYNAQEGEAYGIATGDLPGPGNPNKNFVPVINLSDLPFGSDEGRAMAEIVHDVAPQATLAFHTASLGQADFANGILRLADDVESDVIVDDVLYYAEPFYQDGVIAQAVDQVKAKGVTYFSSAGNQARQSYESEFRPVADTAKLTEGDGFPIGDYILHDFDPGPGVDVFQRIVIPYGTTLAFQWSQAFASICTTSLGAESDMDIFVFTREGDFSSAIFGSLNGNIGNDPFEFLSVNTNFSTEVYIVIGKFVGIPEFDFQVFDSNPNPERIKYQYFGGDLTEEYATKSSTIVGHANAAGAIAVGAVPYFNTPLFNNADPILEYFSSAGGTPILLTSCGEPINEEIRQKPEVIGPDGGNNTFFGGDIEGDGFPNFFGTSASAPHLAAVAALMKQADGELSPDQIETILQNTALDMDDPFTPEPDPGFDFGTGFGLVQALEALSQVSDCQGIAYLELYNADTDQLIRRLSEGDRINSQEAGSQNLAIRAVTVPKSIGSVKFSISGGLNAKKIENTAPYASFGNSTKEEDKVDYFGREFTFGSFTDENYTVEAIAYTQSNAQGGALDTMSLSFTLADELLLSFSLINATTDQTIGILEDFQVINLSEVGDNLNIRANAGNEQNIGSVKFTLETYFFSLPVLERIENSPPFALFGNSGEDFYDGSFVNNDDFYFLTAVPYSEKNLQGISGTPISVVFAVFNDEVLTDTNANDGESPLVVYPNPLNETSDILQVAWRGESPTTSSVTLRLLNQQGEEIYHQQTNASGIDQSYQIDVQKLKLAHGLYFLRIESLNKKPQIVRVMKR